MPDDEFGFEVDTRQLHQLMDNLPTSFRKRVMVGAVASGAKVMEEAAKLRAPVSTGPVSAGHPPPGTLKAAIYKVRLVSECTNAKEVWLVSVRSGKRSRVSKKSGKVSALADGYYASWVEYGHYTRAPASAGPTRTARRRAVQAGQVAGAHFVLPQPFMRPAFDASQSLALAAMRAYMVQTLPIAIAEAKKGGLIR